jgi:hypothetical protein
MIDPIEISTVKDVFTKALLKIPTAIYELSQDVFDLQRFYNSPGSECDTGEFFIENDPNTSVLNVDENTKVPQKIA